jgi:hypothetical protein
VLLAIKNIRQLHISKYQKLLFQILEAFPFAASVPMKSSSSSSSSAPATNVDEPNFPLHHILKLSSGLSDFSLALLKAYPPAAGAKYNNSNGFISVFSTCSGKYPLQKALESDDVSLELILALLEAKSDVLHEKTKDNETVLHLAIRNKVNSAIISTIFRAYPAAVCITDNRGKLPLHLAVQSELSADSLTELVLADLPINEDGSPNTSYSYSWTYILDPMRNIAPHVLTEICTNCFENRIKFCKQLAYARDEKGREAIGIVHSEIRNIMLNYVMFIGISCSISY